MLAGEGGDMSMRRLTVIRHAKSSWKYPDLDDADRPLNRRGRRDAPKMGKRLRARGFEPDLVLVSPALRTVRTLAAIASASDIDDACVRLCPDLFHASVRSLMELLSEVGSGIAHVVVVGHNPSCTQIVESLAQAGIANVPTCGVVSMELDLASWRDLSPGCASLDFFDYPKRDDSGR
jgi:phosphohistidine phosphatase